jgi:hypothetical protein
VIIIIGVLYPTYHLLSRRDFFSKLRANETSRLLIYILQIGFTPAIVSIVLSIGNFSSSERFTALLIILPFAAAPYFIKERVFQIIVIVCFFSIILIHYREILTKLLSHDLISLNIVLELLIIIPACIFALVNRQREKLLQPIIAMIIIFVFAVFCILVYLVGVD